jgi:hypothetical protein
MDCSTATIQKKGNAFNALQVSMILPHYQGYARLELFLVELVDGPLRARYL